MKQFRPLILTAFVLLIVGATTPTSGEKELIIRLQGEVLVLQRQVRDLQESFDKWQGLSSMSLQKLSENSTTTVRGLSSLEDMINSSQSAQKNNQAGTNAQILKISEQLSQNNQNFSRISQQINNLEKSILEYQQKLESREKAEKSLETSSLANNPEALYALAYNNFNQGNYEMAIKQFRSYLNSNARTEDADDALFWLAESLSSLSRYSEALREYDRLLTEYPKGDKALRALLKKGLTLLHLEKRNEGVAILRSIISSYPNSQEANSARNELTRLGEAHSPNASPQQAGPNRQRPL